MFMLNESEKIQYIEVVLASCVRYEDFYVAKEWIYRVFRDRVPVEAQVIWRNYFSTFLDARAMSPYLHDQYNHQRFPHAPERKLNADANHGQGKVQ